MSKNYVGLTYRGRAPYVRVQMMPSMSYSVVIRKDRLHRFKDSEVPRSEHAIEYYKSLESLGVVLVESGNDSPVASGTLSGEGPSAQAPSEVTHRDDVKLGQEYSIDVDGSKLRQITSQKEDDTAVSKVSTELTDEEIMEYLDSNYSQAQLEELVDRFGISIDQTFKGSLSEQLVINKTPEFCRFISSNL